MSDASSEDERRLITEVFSKRERADEAAARVGETCLKQQDEDRRMAVLAKELAKHTPQQPAPASSAGLGTPGQGTSDKGILRKP